MLAINQVLQQGRYRIINQFGEDGTEVVYEAYDNVRGTNVVLQETLIKLPKVTTVAQQETLKLAFANQVKSLTEIKHESFLHVHDYFSEIDRQYLVMESIEGSNLHELLEKNKKPFAILDVMHWADQLLDALSYLHTQKPSIIHRDVIPQNVKLTANGKIKLQTSGMTKNSNTKITSAGKNQSLVSSLHYSPLEQIWDSLDPASQKVITKSYDERSEEILKQPADARSDIYSLGATLYHLITAQMPIDALERSIDILEGKSDPLPPPNQINPNIPVEISDILMRAMEIKRENRFDSATIMRHILRTALTKMKERENEERRKQSEVSRVTEQKRLEEENQLLEQEILEIEIEPELPTQNRQLTGTGSQNIETEQKRQMELIKQQLREAETQRLIAEQRAAEAEKRLVEKETKSSASAISLAENTKFSQESLPKEADKSKSGTTQKLYSDEPALFAEPSVNSRSSWKIPVIALVLIVLGGAGFGIWKFMASKAAASAPKTFNQTISSSETPIPQPSSESTPAASVDSSQQKTEAPTASLTPEVTEPSASSPELKNKNLSPSAQPHNKKPVIATTKPTANQKKAVTVDDIINDN